MKGYDNFFLPVDDLDAAKRFYGGALGLDLKFDFSDSGMSAYRVGQEEPAIILKDKSVTWFEVSDVKAQYRRMRADGIAFLSEPFHMRTGWTAEFEDPFGNRLGITNYLQ